MQDPELARFVTAGMKPGTAEAMLLNPREQAPLPEAVRRSYEAAAAADPQALTDSGRMPRVSKLER
jgi:hypothetical protein